MESPPFSAENLGQPERADPAKESEQSEPAPSIERPEPPPAKSRTREYLSNERTYLSWMRTAISLMGIAVILGRIHTARLSLAPGPGTTWQLGIILAIVGLITVFLATQHYLAIQRAISNDNDEVTERWVIVFSLAAVLLGSGILYYVLTYIPGNADYG